MAEVAVALWVVDALTKILPGTLPPVEPTTVLRLAAARGEVEAGQVVVWSEAPAERLRARASALGSEVGTIPAGAISCRFVGFVPIDKNSPATPANELDPPAPAEVPDVLLADPVVKLSARRAQPVWVSVEVPRGVAAGLYRGTITIEADDRRGEIPLELTVYDFELPAERHVFVTNWFSTGNIAAAHGLQEGSEAHDEMLGRYARNMAAHRQNVFWVSPRLIGVTCERDGTLSLDTQRFDRTVQTFLDAGVDGRIELQFVAQHGEGGWGSTTIALTTITATDRETGERVQLPPEEGLGPFLAALERHLESKGWLDRAMIHVCDEPAAHNLASWREASDFVHRWAPRIRRIDAIESTDFRDRLEVWVPKLNHLRNWYPFYDAARRDGYELWFYVCCHPTGRFMNRFLDSPLIKPRLLHWLPYRYNLAGYLHWGWNHWKGDPFGTPPPNLPPGDTHVIYPGPDGPLDSLRWEAERDGLEDYEYLWLLEARTRENLTALGATEAFDPAARSRSWCRRIVRDFTDYERDPAALQAVREAMAREIETSAAEPLLVWETLPSEDVPLVPAPIVVELFGVTRPGATVTVNGRAVSVGANGRFHAGASMGGERPAIRVEATLDGKTRSEERVFRIDPNA